MKDDFNIQMKNPLLAKFFEGRYVRMKFMGVKPSDLYFVNMTFKASLKTMLGYQYRYLIFYTENRPVTGTPMMIYTFTNYFVMIDEFKSLKKDIENFTIQRASDLA